MGPRTCKRSVLKKHSSPCDGIALKKPQDSAIWDYSLPRRCGPSRPRPVFLLPRVVLLKELTTQKFRSTQWRIQTAPYQLVARKRMLLLCRNDVEKIDLGFCVTFHSSFKVPAHPIV